MLIISTINQSSRFILILLALDPMFKHQVEQRKPNMKKRLENLPLQATIFVHWAMPGPVVDGTAGLGLAMLRLAGVHQIIMVGVQWLIITNVPQMLILVHGLVPRVSASKAGVEVAG